MSEKVTILHKVEAGVRSRRREDVADLERLLAWADLHSVDPQTQPGAVPATKGGPKLVQVGGDGTPGVDDLCFWEIAIARECSGQALRSAMAAALDLRHRLPGFWAEVRELQVDVWVATKIARMTRSLTKRACALVDAAVAEAVDQGPGRLLALAEAKIIEADEEAQRVRLERARNQRGVRFSKPLPGDDVDDESSAAGLRSVYARLGAEEMQPMEEIVHRLAELLAVHGNYDPDNPPTQAQLDADAFAMLADPAIVLEFLERCETADLGQQPVRKTRGPAVLHVHLSEATVCTRRGVARVEGIGPMLLDQLTNLLDHREIVVKPVVDLREGRSVNGYEHPVDVKERTELRNLGDVFPHATSPPGAWLEHDHPKPYDRDGPPGQTGDHNDAPLTRRHHRAKTHAGFRVVQTGPGQYLWRTPHGLMRKVDHTGTHRVRATEISGGELYFSQVMAQYVSAS